MVFPMDHLCPVVTEILKAGIPGARESYLGKQVQVDTVHLSRFLYRGEGMFQTCNRQIVKLFCCLLANIVCFWKLQIKVSWREGIGEVKAGTLFSRKGHAAEVEVLSDLRTGAETGSVRERGKEIGRGSGNVNEIVTDTMYANAVGTECGKGIWTESETSQEMTTTETGTGQGRGTWIVNGTNQETTMTEIERGRTGKMRDYETGKGRKTETGNVTRELDEVSQGSVTLTRR